MSTTSKKTPKAKAKTRAAATKVAPANVKGPSLDAKGSDLPQKSINKASPAPAKVDSAAPVAAANPTLVGKPQPVVLGPVMRKKELIDTVVTRTGMKKKDAKPVIEGMLAVLGEALSDGRELILPPLGKVMVRKEKLMPNGKVMVVKVRQSNASIPAEPKPFSDAAE